jgi:hypothetical protein
MMKLAAILSVVVLASAPIRAQGASQRELRQGRQSQQPGASDDPAVTPAEIQRMFDAYALVQAQDQLRLTDDQYARFLVRFRSLQDTRRQSQQEHTRLVMELRRLLMQAQPDEMQLRERIQGLQDVDTRAIAEMRKAYDAIDRTLDVKQQATFRVFEEQMERRKIELITRARQANRAKQQQ